MAAMGPAIGPIPLAHRYRRALVMVPENLAALIPENLAAPRRSRAHDGRVPAFGAGSQLGSSFTCSPPDGKDKNELLLLVHPEVDVVLRPRHEDPPKRWTLRSRPSNAGSRNRSDVLQRVLELPSEQIGGR